MSIFSLCHAPIYVCIYIPEKLSAHERFQTRRKLLYPTKRLFPPDLTATGPKRWPISGLPTSTPTATGRSETLS